MFPKLYKYDRAMVDHDSVQVSVASDLAWLSEYCNENSKFRKISACTPAAFTEGRRDRRISIMINRVEIIPNSLFTGCTCMHECTTSLV
jgi:hypothetical protein